MAVEARIGGYSRCEELKPGSVEYQARSLMAKQNGRNRRRRYIWRIDMEVIDDDEGVETSFWETIGTSGDREQKEVSGKW